jgi:HAD superfamily hydrolase (TIGR01509 family)
MGIKAILFDLDGVSVEAVEWHFIAFNKALKEVSGTEISKDEMPLFNGLPTKTKLNMLLSSNRIKEEDIPLIWKKKQDFTIETIKECAKIDAKKIEMHQWIRRSGLESACVTNSIMETADLMLSKTGQKDYLTFIISNEDVKHPKPNSEGYVIAMVKFGFMPNEVLIVEDSEYGIQSAKATGANVWEVSGCHEVTKENLIEQVNKYND